MPTKRARLRRLIYRRFPKWLKQHDFEVFAAVLGIMGGLPILFGRIEPSSPEELLPKWIVLAWSGVLVFGCFLVLLGIILGTRKVFPERIFWMRVEALGLSALAYFCFLYAICVFVVAYDTGGTAGFIILAFGLVALVREFSIQNELEEYRRSLGLGRKA